MFCLALAQVEGVEGLGSPVNNDPAGPKAWQFAVYERSQMVGPLALMFLLFRQPRPSTSLLYISWFGGWQQRFHSWAHIWNGEVVGHVYLGRMP